MTRDKASIAENIALANERISAAASRGGRKSCDITLIAISKTFPAEAVREAYAAGARHFGENRVQEWETKRPKLHDVDAIWHLIGHLQTNKAKRAAVLFHTVDSVDSIMLAQKLDAAIAGEGANSPSAAGAERLSILVEVNLAGEESKSGIAEEDLPGLAETVLKLPHLSLRGLMTIPPFAENPEDARPFFRKLRELRDSLCARTGRALPELSMGMSHDFEIAIEEGATQVRLGTAIFGERRQAL